MKYLHGQWGSERPAAAGAVVCGEFDLVMGSDVLYERDERGDLAAFIGTHCAPSAEVCIVDPNRGNRSAFNRRMAALGFTLDEVRLNVPEALGVLAYRGRMLHYHRSAARWQ